MLALLLLGATAVQPPAPESVPPARVEEQADGLHFTYAWPGEVQALPGLRARLEGDRDRARMEAERCTPAEAECPQAGYQYSKEWQWAGRAGPLVSLHADIYTFTGGAHGNAAHQALLWDVGAERPVALADLFADAAWPARFDERYCAALDRAREERRGAPVVRGEESDTACPALGAATALPADTDENGRFDTLRVLLPPYAAGPYAEGSYEPEVRFTAQDIAALREDLRVHFEVRR